MSQTIKEVKASTDSVLKLTIKPDNGDWLQVYLEDFGRTENDRHSGRLVLVVSGDAYSHYWSHMSTPLIEFIQTASNGYLITKLTNSNLKEQIDATGDEMRNELIKTIFEQRRDESLSKEDARDLYDDIQNSDWERPTDEHELLYRIYGCEWWECIPQVENPEYEHFSKVIDLLKQGLAQHVAEQAGSQKATKYDWSEVPLEVQWIATDEEGKCAHGYVNAPTRCDVDGEWACKDSSELFAQINSAWCLKGFEGDWRDSLEQRPVQGGGL